MIVGMLLRYLFLLCSGTIADEFITVYLMSSFNKIETRATMGLAGIFSLRMLGLFMLLPVFSIYASTQYEDASPFLIGLAIGVYGLGQAIFQIPFGLLSDRVGRKPLIYFGLVLFALGGLVAAMADTIYGVIFGRAVQGSGAIAAVTMACLADLTRDENRAQAMAVVGMSIGLSFMLAMILGPVFASWFGLPGIFWITSLLALFGLAICYFWIPSASARPCNAESLPVLAQIKEVIKDPQLQRLNVGVFILHLVLTASFVVLPLVLMDQAGLEAAKHWQVYLPVIGLSFFAMIPLILVAEKYRKIKPVFVSAIFIMCIGLFMLVFEHRSLMGVAIALFVFFFAFNLLEALLPSLVSKIAPAGSKGTAMGIYSSGQFLGAFLGGVSGGALYGWIGPEAVFMVTALLAMVWMYFAQSMAPPKFLHNLMVELDVDIVSKHFNGSHEGALKAILAIEGVEDAVVIDNQSIVHLKVNKDILDAQQLDKFVLVKQ